MIFLNDQQAQIEIWKLLMEYANMLEVDSGLIEDLLELLSSSGVEKRFLKRLEKIFATTKRRWRKSHRKKGDPMEHLRRVKFFVFDAFFRSVYRILEFYLPIEIIKYTCFVHFMSVKDIKIQNMMHISRWLKSA